MKSWIILIVVAVITTITASVAVPLLANDPSAGIPKTLVAPPVEISESAPKVEVVEPLAYDFGVLAQETDRDHGWTFKNTGKGVLELRNLGTDCSCTVAQIGKVDAAGNQKTMLPVAPGASEPIELKWNTRKIDGSYRKSARIGTNDPRHPEVVLSVQGKVYPAVVVIPTDSVVGFQTVSNDEDFVRKVYLYSKDRPAMKITRLACSKPELLTIKAAPMTAEELGGLKVEAGTAIELTLKASDKLGAFKEELLIQTDHPAKPEIRLAVTGRVTGPITFAPERVTIRDATSSDGGSTSVVVWVRGRSATEIKVAKAPPGVEVAFTPLPLPAGAKGTKYKMTVQVAPGSPAGQINDEIVLKTDHPNAAEIRVPLDVLVQGKN